MVGRGGGVKTRREEWENRFRSRGRETARLAANGAMPDESPAVGTPAETGAAGAGSLFTEGATGVFRFVR